MDRDDLLALLARAVADGLLTEDEAAELLAQFDAGTLDLDQLPIPPDEAVTGLDGTEEAAALALLLLLLGSDSTANDLATLSTAARTVLLDATQDAFEARVAALAQRLADGAITLAEWQAQMAAALRENMVAQALAGSGQSSLSAAQLARIDDLVRREAAYLSRFADTVAVRQAQDTPLSLAQIANRAQLYGGAGRAEFYRSLEEAEDPGRGYVVDYISRDDPSTCGECLAAQNAGPYRVGDGPMPGEICLGRGRCRCVRELRFVPDEYNRLSR